MNLALGTSAALPPNLAKSAAPKLSFRNRQQQAACTIAPRLARNPSDHHYSAISTKPSRSHRGVCERGRCIDFVHNSSGVYQRAFALNDALHVCCSPEERHPRQLGVSVASHIVKRFTSATAPAATVMCQTPHRTALELPFHERYLSACSVSRRAENFESWKSVATCNARVFRSDLVHVAQFACEIVCRVFASFLARLGLRFETKA